MNNSLNYMSFSNNDYVDKLEFLENDDEAMFMFESINYTPKEPLPKDELSALRETYFSFNYTSSCCYNLHEVLIMDAYIYNKFCKSQSCFALGQANDLKKGTCQEKIIFSLTM
jgi:hypothetical protein